MQFDANRVVARLGRHVPDGGADRAVLRPRKTIEPHRRRLPWPHPPHRVGRREVRDQTQRPWRHHGRQLLPRRDEGPRRDRRQLGDGTVDRRAHRAQRDLVAQPLDSHPRRLELALHLGAVTRQARDAYEPVTERGVVQRAHLARRQLHRLRLGPLPLGLVRARGGLHARSELALAQCLNRRVLLRRRARQHRRDRRPRPRHADGRRGRLALERERIGLGVELAAERLERALTVGEARLFARQPRALEGAVEHQQLVTGAHLPPQRELRRGHHPRDGRLDRVRRPVDFEARHLRHGVNRYRALHEPGPPEHREHAHRPECQQLRPQRRLLERTEGVRERRGHELPRSRERARGGPG